MLTSVMECADGLGAGPLAARILLVEDHDDSANATARLLRGSGHLVTVAKSYAAAVEAAATGFDLLVADIGLPDHSGIEVLQTLAHGGTFRSIAVTAYAMPEEVQRCMDAGFDAHLPKPIEFRKLEQTIARLVVSAAAPRHPEQRSGRTATELLAESERLRERSVHLMSRLKALDKHHALWNKAWGTVGTVEWRNGVTPPRRAREEARPKLIPVSA
ncbi:MAG: sensor hybrid histidine kinase [Phycisphaerales bacterium]|nr:sensor hybrid histidine kinase [Phycisphaerales bacterium]